MGQCSAEPASSGAGRDASLADLHGRTTPALRPARCPRHSRPLPSPRSHARPLPYCPCLTPVCLALPAPAVTPFVERMAKRMDDMAEAAELEVGKGCTGGAGRGIPWVLVLLLSVGWVARGYESKGGDGGP